MSEDKKILILYASYGDGHRQVAAALEQELVDRGMEVVKVDLYASAYPFLNAITRYCYLKSYVFGSRLYGWSYYATRDLPGNLRSLFRFGLRKLRHIIEVEKPAAVISTFPFSALSEIGKPPQSPVPLFTVITDFALHDLWMDPAIDGIFVATEDLRDGLMKKGIRAERIHVSGIPIRHCFHGPDEGLKPKTFYCDDPSKKTVLVMAGAYGVSGDIRKIVRGFEQNGQIRLLVVCGKNEKLLSLLQSEFSGCPGIHVFGYVDHIADLMANADCIVTKAGGITLSEALAMDLPSVIFRPMPGQEKENAAYLSAKGAALVAERDDDLIELAIELLQDERRMERMKSAIRCLQRGASTGRIVSDIIAELSKREPEASQRLSIHIDSSTKGVPHFL